MGVGVTTDNRAFTFSKGIGNTPEKVSSEIKQ